MVKGSYIDHRFLDKGCKGLERAVISIERPCREVPVEVCKTLQSIVTLQRLKTTMVSVQGKTLVESCKDTRTGKTLGVCENVKQP